MATRPTYDSAVIYDFAGRLLRQAATIILTYTVVGALIGLGIGWFGTAAASGAANPIGTLILAVVLGGLGFLMGRSAAFRLRLQAQVALCQVAIEENTRPR